MKDNFDYSEIIAAPDADEAGSKAAKECQNIGVYAVFPPQVRKGMDWNDVLQEMGTVDGHAELQKSLHLKTVAHEKEDARTIPEIENILEDLDEDPCKDLSLEHFPPILKQYIESICETTEAHPIMITMSVLCTISSFVGTKAYIPEGKLGFFQTLYPNLWSLCINQSGGFKSTALKKELEAILVPPKGAGSM